jgi:drug/metabolite transporter (DMT)-like permease
MTHAPDGRKAHEPGGCASPRAVVRALMSRPPILVRLAPPLFVFLWATGFVAARLVVPHADPLTFLVLRYALAAAILTFIALAAGAPWPATARAWRNGMVAGVLIHGGYLGAVFWAIKHGLPAGISALIAGLQPLVTGLLVGPFLGERVSARRWLGIAIGFLGTALVVVPKLGAVDGFPPLALTVCFLGTVSITLGTIWQKRTAAAVDLRTNAVAQFVGAGLATAPVALLLESGRLDPVPELFIGLSWSVVALSIGAIGLLLVLIRRGAVAGVAALLYLVPPVSALMAYFLFGEELSPMQMLGMLVAAAGVALASRG